jgi:hypothetical protein
MPGVLAPCKPSGRPRCSSLEIYPGMDKVTCRLVLSTSISMPKYLLPSQLTLTWYSIWRVWTRCIMACLSVHTTAKSSTTKQNRIVPALFRKHDGVCVILRYHGQDQVPSQTQGASSVDTNPPPAASLHPSFSRATHQAVHAANTCQLFPMITIKTWLHTWLNVSTWLNLRPMSSYTNTCTSRYYLDIDGNKPPSRQPGGDHKNLYKMLPLKMIPGKNNTDACEYMPNAKYAYRHVKRDLAQLNVEVFPSRMWQELPTRPAATPIRGVVPLQYPPIRTSGSQSRNEIAWRQIAPTATGKSRAVVDHLGTVQKLCDYGLMVNDSKADLLSYRTRPSLTNKSS